MIYKGDIGLYLSGSPVPIPSCAIYILQPKVRDIEQFGEMKFLMAVQMFGQTEKFLDEVKQGNPQLESMSDFEILLTMFQTEQSIQDYADSFFELICPDYEVKYDKHSIQFFIQEEEKSVLKGQITPWSFEDFQRTVKELFITETQENADYNPANDKAREIYEKIKRGKERVREMGGGDERSGDGSSLYGTYASILAIGLQMDINVFFNYTPFQICDSFNRYWAKINSDFYRKLATTPMMDVSKVDEPEEWTRNLYAIGNN